MKRVYEETTRSDAFIALGLAVTALHNIVMSDECGIQHYKTDFLHDLMGIMKQLVELDDKHKESKMAFSYRHVIGTRESGTYNAMNEVERKYWLLSTIKGVGINIFRKQNGGNIETEIWLLEPDEIAPYVQLRHAEYAVYRVAATGSEDFGWDWKDKDFIGTFDGKTGNPEIDLATVKALTSGDVTRFYPYCLDEWTLVKEETGEPIFHVTLREKVYEEPAKAESPKLETFEVWAIDAWCNDEDGWWLNDPSKVGEFDATFDDVESGFLDFMLRHGPGLNGLEFDWYSENECEVRFRSTVEPLFQIVQIKED